jgi:hypothetical protein
VPILYRGGHAQLCTLSAITIRYLKQAHLQLHIRTFLRNVALHLHISNCNFFRSPQCQVYNLKKCCSANDLQKKCCSATAYPQSQMFQQFTNSKKSCSATANSRFRNYCIIADPIKVTEL